MAISTLADKTVLITGGAAGIGLEAGLAFAKRSARLILTDLNREHLETAKNTVLSSGAASCAIHSIDVTDETAMGTLAEEIHRSVPALDVLVNNAGIGFLGPFVDTPMEAWRRVMEVNLLGVVRGCALFIPAMVKAGGARHVVNIASGAGLGPIAGLSAYTASKHAVVGFTDTLAIELSDTQVDVSVVCPGIINTAIVNMTGHNAAPSVRREQVQKIGQFYQDKGCHPREVAEAIVRAVEIGRGKVTVGPMATSGFLLHRLLPHSWYQKLAKMSSKQIGYWI